MAEQNQAKKESHNNPDAAAVKSGLNKWVCGASLVTGIVSMGNLDDPRTGVAQVAAFLIAAATISPDGKQTLGYYALKAVEENAPRIAAKTLQKSPEIVKAFGCAIRSATQVIANQIRKAKVRAEINRQNKKYLSPNYEASLYLNENGKKYKIPSVRNNA